MCADSFDTSLVPCSIEEGLGFRVYGLRFTVYGSDRCHASVVSCSIEKPLLRLYEGSSKALVRLYEGSTKALGRLYNGSIADSKTCAWRCVRTCWGVADVGPCVSAHVGPGVSAFPSCHASLIINQSINRLIDQ